MEVGGIFLAVMAVATAICVDDEVAYATAECVRIEKARSCCLGMSAMVVDRHLLHLLLGLELCLCPTVQCPYPPLLLTVHLFPNHTPPGPTPTDFSVPKFTNFCFTNHFCRASAPEACDLPLLARCFRRWECR